jgi:hypothetical protein
MEECAPAEECDPMEEGVPMEECVPIEGWWLAGLFWLCYVVGKEDVFNVR